ncbi:MAG: carboxylating nicotinate-nucleotide diphosphorylase [Bacteroidales bacterium]|jgi:nicotinate-nucleotide pyrophosphorylase (carboxylating)|nr:carboxylating nicotinate-nucleotide diphosphorylase [Bacteroidales bacterium]MCR4931398.1 carboxylating nicotinate-nucleotide diphosphorylase [Bacteroidales bacterium]
MTDIANLDELIRMALREDIGDGDHSTLACIPSTAVGTAKMVAKQDGVLCGAIVGERVFHQVDPTLKVSLLKNDGDAVKKGDIVMLVEGHSGSILTAERTALNFMQRLSGIATETKRMVAMLDGLNTRLLDTRKTTPNMRLLEKYAVACGGGTNHRIGLYDMIMLKDNHIDFAGGIEAAIDRTRQYLKEKGKNLKIEIEVRNLDELERVLAHGGVDRIMLDNFDIPTLREAVRRIDGRFETEASGGITDQTLRPYAETGVDFISVGALTHHIKSLDLSLVKK